MTRGEAGIDGVPPGEAAPLREREQRASAAVVGVETVEFLTTATASSRRASACAATSPAPSGGTGPSSS